MADLRRRVSFLRERHPPSKSGAAKGAATKLAKDDLRITVLGRSAGSSSSSQRPDPLPAEVPMETSGPCSTVSSRSVEPPPDAMSTVTSEGGLSASDVDPDPLPPSGRVAGPAFDPEMAAMLARAAAAVGLEWTEPPPPEPSRLDDWYFGGARASQSSPPVPFFPEVHEELTRSWKTPFSARNRPFQPSPLTSLEGGDARGYTGIPSVERPVAMQLCPAGVASSWRDQPTLPSRACKQSSALTGAAYKACGEAASALHAMALLQVHQAKALRDLHAGGHDSAEFSELRAATDLALRATKVTARAVGRAMSTLVVQERHLWLCLADMKDADKTRLLNAPVSQTGLFGETVEEFAQQFSAAKKQTEAIAQIMPRRKRPAPAPSTSAPQPAPRRGRPAAAASVPPRGSSKKRGTGRQQPAPPAQPAPKGGKRRSKRP